MPSTPLIPDVLASRYASTAMATIWSPEHKIVLERQLWVAVLKAQQDLGVDVPDGVVQAYEAVINEVDLDSIRRREAVTRHDVKARIEEFCALSGHEHIHKGMTSRDLTENVEQLQILASMNITRDKVVSVLARLAAGAVEYDELAIAGRSHNVAAQMTTLGKRFASAADELLVAHRRLEELLPGGRQLAEGEEDRDAESGAQGDRSADAAQRNAVLVAGVTPSDSSRLRVRGCVETITGTA